MFADYVWECMYWDDSLAHGRAVFDQPPREKKYISILWQTVDKTVETRGSYSRVAETMFDDTTSGSDDTALVRASYDPDRPKSLAVTISEAVARAKGVGTEELEFGLFDTLDPDALEMLFTPTDQSTHEAEIRFVVAEHAVVVRNTGEVFVRPLD